MNIGIIGYGELGSRIGRRIIQNGYPLYGFDISKTATEKMHAEGIAVLSAPSEVAEVCEIIITCVDDDISVEDVILGENGVIKGIQKRAIVIEMTTSTPSMTKKIGRQLRDVGADIIDAPVSRGIPAAEKGTLSILVGGEIETLNKCHSVLKILGSDIIHCGTLGAGHAVKAINMMMMSCNLLSSTEVLTLGLKAGLDFQKMLDVINVSSGENYMTSHHFPKYVLSGSYDSKFSFGLMKKDLEISLKMAQELDITPVMGRRAGDIYGILASKVSSEEDNMESIKEIQAWMGGF